MRNRRICKNCQTEYSVYSKLCPNCGCPNPNQLTDEKINNMGLLIIKRVLLVWGLAAAMLIMYNVIKAAITVPEEGTTWRFLYDALSGNSEMNLFAGFSIVWVLFVIAIAWLIPIIIIRCIIKSIRKSRERDKDAFDKAYELQKKKLDFENEQYTSQKIIRCEYCGKLTRFGDGTCKNCGGSLRTPND